MGVPGFYSWLIKRYPLIKHMVDKQQLPSIDYLYLDMNGIIYKCVKDDSIIFKSQILPKELEEIWLEVFNYIDMIVNILKPNKMLVMALDGVAPRSKMNNQRARRFKSARDHQRFLETYYGFTETRESQQNFKNNSISPGTKFMQELNKNIDFFIKKKIEEDDYWKNLSIVFTGSDVPGEGEHKIMEFIRENSQKFLPEDNHCLYGADADLIMLSMTLPLPNLCIIREQYIHQSSDVRIIKSKQKKTVKFQIIFITILRQYFELEYSELKDQMKIPYEIKKIIADFVFLFFFIGNDFLPRCMAYNIREASIEYLINAFKQFLKETDDHITGGAKINLLALILLSKHISSYQQTFFQEKVEEFNKLAEVKVEFENQLSQMMRMKANTQKQFLTELRTSYLNQSTQGKQRFYQMKFNVNPSEQINDYYNIISYYLHGLEFVYEYYFTLLPSWQWYYPYYYAPLLSDLYFFLMSYVQSGYQIQDLPTNEPSQPFKQLMCILPKQSAELLPEPFQEFILSEESPLRKPYDFYPDEFDDDMYGSTRAHEAVSLIPFLDLEIVNKVYDEAMSKTNQNDARRNKFGTSILYEFNSDGNQISIESNFPAIQNVRCTIDVINVNLRQSFNWKTLKNITWTDKQSFRMPTLKIMNFRVTSSQTSKRKSLVVELQKNEENEKIKIGSEVFYGYPLEHSGKVEGILTQDKFMHLGSFDGYEYELDRYGHDFLDLKVIAARKKELFNALKDQLSKKQRNSIDWSRTTQLYFIKDTMSFIRCQNGEIKKVNQIQSQARFVIKPSELVKTRKSYETTREDIKFASLEEEFPLGENVLVFPESREEKAEQKVPLPVLKGQVVGYEKNKVKVKVNEKIKGINDDSLKTMINTNEIYFTMSFVKFITGIKPDIITTLLDSINIIPQNPDLPPSIDIGLNFISRRSRKIVSNLVRINFAELSNRDFDQKKQFKKLEISYRGLQLILEYKEKYGNVIEFIEERQEKLVENRDANGKINWKEHIYLSNMFKEEEKAKAIKSLMSVYLWLIKKQETHMPLLSIYSKQVAAKKIEEMSNVFRESQQKQTKKIKYEEPQLISVNPNYLFSRRLSSLSLFHLCTYKGKEPKPHTIRDQVICLKPEFFGDYGLVVGVDDDRYEVLFQKSKFGKTNLNGLCRELYGGKFSERQLYNMHLWPKYITPRQDKKYNELQNLGCLSKNSKGMVPKSKALALDNLASIEKLQQTLQKNGNKNIFSDKFLKHIENLKKMQKVEKIDPEYNIVDNRRHDYKYKYDKGQSNISNEQVQGIKKQIKYREKSVAEIARDMEDKGGVSTDFKTQVIVSKQVEEERAKVEEKQSETQNKDPQSEEEDGDDILA